MHLVVFCVLLGLVFALADRALTLVFGQQVPTLAFPVQAGIPSAAR